MNAIKYIGMDVHLATISIAVLDGNGKLIMEVTIATHAGALLDFIRGLSGSLNVTFEEGTAAHSQAGGIAPPGLAETDLPRQRAGAGVKRTVAEL